MFQVPARLVIKGGRGVRIERAEQGRVFGQEQLLGFSTSLAYAVERTETFWPYFQERELVTVDRGRRVQPLDDGGGERVGRAFS